MKWFLLVLTAIAFVLGVTIMLIATLAVHEIEAIVLLLIAAVFLSGAAIVDAIQTMTRRFEALEELASSQT